MFRKFKKICLYLVLLFLLFTPQIQAKTTTIQDYDISYNIQDNANTNVYINVKIKNLSKDLFTSVYKLSLGLTDISNFKVKSNSTDITSEIIKDSKGSVITLNFKDRIVGINKNLELEMSFDTKDIAKNYNNVWEINIPGMEENENSTYKVTVSYPKKLGNATNVKPNKFILATESGELKFTQNDLKGSGISIIFGTSQVYNLNLKYHLKNSNLISVITEIALPPNTNYQTVEIDSLTPKPINVIKDKDGNWLAKYKLNPSQAIDVSLKGKVKVELFPKQEIIDPKLKSEYLKPQKYWETQDKEIINLANKLKTPKAIYEYVVKKLNYDYTKLEGNNLRLGAYKSLANPNSGVCLEFTDLFIAIARAAGIPAREVDGFAYTTNKILRPSSLVKDVLHVWPQYYDFDKNQWIMVDPTWGSTTGGVDYFNLLDVDHITFAIKGTSSTYPIPAGGYKNSNNYKKSDINITLSSKMTNKQSVSPEIRMSEFFVAGFPVSGIISISNNGNTEISNKKVNISSQTLFPNNQNLLTGSILPFGKEDITFNYNPTSLLTNTKDTIKISVDNNFSQKKVFIRPFFKDKNILIGGGLIVIFGIIVPIVAIGIRRLSISKRK